MLSITEINDNTIYKHLSKQRKCMPNNKELYKTISNNIAKDIFIACKQHNIELKVTNKITDFITYSRDHNRAVLLILEFGKMLEVNHTSIVNMLLSIKDRVREYTIQNGLNSKLIIDKAFEDAVCSICYEDMDEMITCPICTHISCIKCAKKIIQNNIYVCPICRSRSLYHM